jgi:hypothetical protein
MEDQERRRAQNELLFRTLNEQIKRIDDDRRASSDVLDLVCECSSATCMKPLTVPRDEYETVRANPTWFIVAPGHQDLEIEAVVVRDDRYLIVEKRGEASALAEGTDPRT